MTNEQLVEQIAETIACNGPTGLQYPWHTEAACAILPIILAAREEGARAMRDHMQEAFEEMLFMQFWRVDGMNTEQARIHAKAQAEMRMRSIDPAKIAGGSDAESD